MSKFSQPACLQTDPSNPTAVLRLQYHFPTGSKHLLLMKNQKQSKSAPRRKQRTIQETPSSNPDSICVFEAGAAQELSKNRPRHAWRLQTSIPQKIENVWPKTISFFVFVLLGSPGFVRLLWATEIDLNEKKTEIQKSSPEAPYIAPLYEQLCLIHRVDGNSLRSPGYVADILLDF